MQQVASQLGVISPMSLHLGAYNAYTQAVSTNTIPWAANQHFRMISEGTCDSEYVYMQPIFGLWSG